ncbi:MAG: hypothetical protein ABIJ39_14525 [Chloroflexota bacterium]
MNSYDLHSRHRSLLSKLLPWIGLYSPILIAIGLMLPRLITPQFGLFDDGRILVTAEKIASGTWYTGLDNLEGRFRPIHWLWFTLSYWAGGLNPFWFYVSNTFALVAIVGGLILLVQKCGGSKLQAWLTGFFFVISGSVVEGFFTLKGEVIQLAWMLFSILFVLPYANARTWQQRAIVLVSTSLALVLANLSKETAIVLLPVSLVWYLLARFWPGYKTDYKRRQVTKAYFWANLIAMFVFFSLRATALTAQVDEGTYSARYAFQFEQITISAIRWIGWIIRDFSWVVPLVVVFIILLILKQRMMKRNYLIEAIVWMGAWICVYLPWNFMTEYYMLPFSLGLAVFVSALVAEITKPFHEPGRKKAVPAVALALSAVLLAGSLFNNLTNARVQLAVDNSNAPMMAYLVQNTELNSKIFVNIQDPNEYVSEIRTQLGDVYNRPDLEVLPFDFDLVLSPEDKIYYIISPYVVNQPLLTVRMGIVEDTQNMWNDDLEEYLQLHPRQWIVLENEESFNLSNVNYPRLFCSFITTRSFCAANIPLVDTRLFQYGWRIYRLEAP